MKITNTIKCSSLIVEWCHTTVCFFSIKSFNPCISKIITSMIQHHIFYILCPFHYIFYILCPFHYIFYILCPFHYIFYILCPCSTSFGIALDVKHNHEFVSHCFVGHPVRLWRYFVGHPVRLWRYFVGHPVKLWRYIVGHPVRLWLYFVGHPVRLWRYFYWRLQLYLLLYTKMPYYLKVSMELVVLQKALSDQV